MSNDHKRVIITGGRGFVGQHLERELREKWLGVQIAVWDLPETDITEPQTYQAQLKELQPEWVIHLAGLAAVAARDVTSADYFAINTEGTQRLLECVAQHSPATRLLVVSSADIYGLAVKARAGEPIAELPIAECRPANVYAESKLAMERIIEETFLDRVIRVRPFPHLGPGQRQGFVTADFAAQIVAIERGLQEPVLRVGTLQTRRDFTDVRDVVRAYRLLMEAGTVGEVYNVGTGVAWSIQEIVDRLLALSTVTISLEQDHTRLRPNDVPVLVADTTKLRMLTGWQPQISLEQSLMDVLADWRGREA